MSKFDLTALEADVSAEITYQPKPRPALPHVDISPIIQEFKEHEYFILGIQGSRPQGDEFDPRQPYNWHEDSLTSMRGVLTPLIVQLMKDHGKVLVVARNDAGDAGFAALQIVDLLATKLATNPVAGVEIRGLPLEVFMDTTRTGYRNAPDGWQEWREMIRTNNLVHTAGAYLKTVFCLSQYTGKPDYQAVEWAISMNADLTYAFHSPKYNPLWEIMLKDLGREQGIGINALRVQLHNALSGAKSSPQGLTAGAISMARYATFDSVATKQPQETRFEASPYDGEDGRTKEDFTEEEQRAIEAGDADAFIIAATRGHEEKQEPTMTDAPPVEDRDLGRAPTKEESEAAEAEQQAEAELRQDMESPITRNAAGQFTAE